MRKILTSVLSVAGLLAVVLAIASSPASAQLSTTLSFYTDYVPGTYTVEWRTRGNCNPTSLSGQTITASTETGSISRTVAAPASAKSYDTVSSTSPDYGDKATGESRQQAMSIIRGNHCTYEFKFLFTSGLSGDKGTSCAVDLIKGKDPTVGGSNALQPGNVDAAVAASDTTHWNPSAWNIISTTETINSFDVQNNACNKLNVINVTVGPSPAAKSGDTPATYRDADGLYQASDPTAGAVLNTQFKVTATPMPNSHAECQESSAMTKPNNGGTDNTKNDDKVFATVKVVQTTLEGSQTCKYNVMTELPNGFTVASAGSNTSKVENYTTAPVNEYVKTSETTTVTREIGGLDCGRSGFISALGTDNALGGEGTAADTTVAASSPVSSTALCVTHTVKVAQRDIYITQKVEGNAGGATARYTLSEDKACRAPAAPGLPPNMVGTGGIVTTPAVTTVELREGHFNISKAVMGPTMDDVAGRYRALRLALNHEAKPCTISAAVSNLPDNCKPGTSAGVNANAEHSRDLSADNPDDDDVNGNQVVIAFDIHCEDMSMAMDDDMDMDDDMHMDDDMDMDMDDDMHMDDDMDMDMDMDDDMDMDMGPPADMATG